MPPTPPRTIVGIDLSLTSTGIAVIDTTEPVVDDLVQLSRVESKGYKDADLHARAVRLDNICDLIYTRLGDDAPRDTLIVIEAPAFASKTGHMHDRSGLWWLVVHGLHVEGYTVAEVAPTARAKYATGKGNAGKDQVLAAVVRRYPDVDVTGNDVADALVLAAMGARHLGHPIDDLPQTHLAAMDAVRWPELPGNRDHYRDDAEGAA